MCLIKRLTYKTKLFFPMSLMESPTIHGISFTILKLVKIAHNKPIMGWTQRPFCLQNCLLAVLNFMKLFIMQIYSNRFNGYIQVFSLLFDIWNSYIKLCGWSFKLHGSSFYFCGFSVRHLNLKVSFLHGAIFVSQSELCFLKWISASGPQVHCS